MTEHNKHDNGIVENYKEEGAVTVESLNVAHHTHHQTHAKKGFTLSTPAAIIIASVIISCGLMGYGYIVGGGSNSGAATNKPFTGKAIEDSEYVDGNAKAKVFIVEYSDAECPFCTQLSPTIKRVRQEYSDKIGFVYRHFPLTQIHKNAFDYGREMSCVGVAGGGEKFFAFHDAIFENKLARQSATHTQAIRDDILRKLGVDLQAFNTCMSSRQTEQTVNDQMNDGVAAGVQGTPSTFILKKTRKGYEVVTMVDGARPYEFFKTAIDQALEK